ncbi:MAG: GldG family protein [Clostridiales bacterium]|nr:GldG family protein [Clostridiales bacterium]
MKNIFSDKRFRYGTYSTLTAVVVIAIAVLVNLIAGSINYKKDLTPNSIYALTDTTKEVLEGLDDDVTIYALYQTGQEDTVITQILDQYEFASGNIDVSVKDPVLYPQFVEKYTESGSVSTGSLIVEKGDRYKIIPYSDLYSSGMDYTTGETTQTVAAESKITSAIQYVTAESLPIIYTVTGHNEMTLSDLGSPLEEDLETANYEVREINLFDEDIPDDCSILLATTPMNDYTAAEAEKAKAFLASDGRAIFLIDYQYNTFENLSSILADYGLSLDNPIIFEGDSSYQYENYPTAILPDIAIHDATEGMSQKRVLFLTTYGITTLEDKRVSTTVEPLLTTSSSAFGKVNDDETVTKTDDDIAGPFGVAVAVTDSTYTDTSHITKLVVCSAYYYTLYSQADALVSYENSDFVLGCINWLNDKSDTEAVTIVSKSLASETFYTDYSQSERIKYTCVIFLPVFIIGMGFCVWFSRRNK